MLFLELREKHLADDATFFVNGAPRLQAACYRHGGRLQHEEYRNRNAVERVFGQ